MGRAGTLERYEKATSAVRVEGPDGLGLRRSPPAFSLYGEVAPIIRILESRCSIITSQGVPLPKAE